MMYFAHIALMWWEDKCDYIFLEDDFVSRRLIFLYILSRREAFLQKGLSTSVDAGGCWVQISGYCQFIHTLGNKNFIPKNITR